MKSPLTIYTGCVTIKFSDSYREDFMSAEVQREPQNGGVLPVSIRLTEPLW